MCDMSLLCWNRGHSSLNRVMDRIGLQADSDVRRRLVDKMARAQKKKADKRKQPDQIREKTILKRRRYKAQQMAKEISAHNNNQYKQRYQPKITTSDVAEAKFKRKAALTGEGENETPAKKRKTIRASAEAKRMLWNEGKRDGLEQSDFCFAILAVGGSRSSSHLESEACRQAQSLQARWKEHITSDTRAPNSTDKLVHLIDCDEDDEFDLSSAKT